MLKHILTVSELRKRIERKLLRSNNSLESWHKAISQDIVDHPNINRLEHHLIKEQNLKDCHSNVNASHWASIL
ncbi:hypothetical protein BpHYR1_012700 [Brachionus plicatilis]|uniref:Uncharacterized protein n=1 Tax=Brachionus plicatilis TaxID=10195 RepID=A0A3M7QH01_BRAPC|nr:hypothetical protein BpHYR1_012700 [Brachionus plicatilis]